MRVSTEHSDSEKHVANILDDICVAIKKSGATPVLFEHWSTNPEKMRAYCVEAARKHQAKVAFCGSSVAEVRAETGDKYFETGFARSGHINDYGNYLWTCCLHACLTGKSPIGLAEPKRKHDKGVNISKQDVLYFQKKAWECQQRFNKLLEESKK
jgi:hypothetical protein